jgi:hypothetical protein
VILLGLRRTGYGRMLYAVGDNPIAARLSGARAWQVLVVLYIISALIAAVAGFLISGLTNVSSVTLADSYVLPSVAAAVIGGTSILGGRGGYAGTIVGALILTVLTSLLSALGFPEAVRQVLFGAIIVVVAAGLHAGHRRDVSAPEPTGSGSRHLGLDLGGTNIKWAVVEHDGDGWTCLDRGQVATPISSGEAAVVDRLISVGRDVVDRWPGIASVGIGVPGLYDPVSGVAPVLRELPTRWAGTPVASPVSQALDLPCALINDARAFGLAELRLGAGRERGRWSG